MSRDREPGRVVLRLLEERLRHAPELPRAHARRQPLAEPLAVDQPAGLRIAADDGGEEHAGDYRAQPAPDPRMQSPIVLHSAPTLTI